MIIKNNFITLFKKEYLQALYKVNRIMKKKHSKKPLQPIRDKAKEQTLNREY